MPSFGEMSMAICRVPWGDTSQRFVNWSWCLCLPNNMCWLEILGITTETEHL